MLFAYTVVLVYHHRPLKRLLFFMFSLQSSQYHFAVTTTCQSAINPLFFLLLLLFSFFFFFLVSLSSSRDREIRYEGSGRLTITFRSNLQPHTIQMEPLLGTPLGVTSHHLAITNAITIAIRQLISIDLGILFVALGSRLGALVISGGAVLLRRNELCCLARTFLVAPFVVRDRLLERSARGA